MTQSIKDFLLKDVTTLIEALKSDTQPLWGVMTPQHMVEHLIFVTKVTLKRYGDPEAEYAAHQAKMKAFIEGERTFPKNITPLNAKPDLKPLRFNNLDEAITALKETLQKYYAFNEANPGFKSYNSHMGELDFKLTEKFHYKHYKHHLEQFNLLPEVKST